MCLAQRPQRSDTDEAWTHSPSVSSQAHSHWATVLQMVLGFMEMDDEYFNVGQEPKDPRMVWRWMMNMLVVTWEPDSPKV